MRNIKAASIGEYMAFLLRLFLLLLLLLLLLIICISWNSAHYVRKQQTNKKPLYSSISRFRLNRICMLMRRAKAKIKQTQNKKPQHQSKQNAMWKRKTATIHGERISATKPTEKIRRKWYWCGSLSMNAFFSSYGNFFFVRLKVCVCT